MIKEIFIAMIKLYKIMFSWKRPCCRYVPTCSTYALDAITRYGVLKGGFLALKRILRCRPSLKKNRNYGYDPIP